MIQDAMGLPQGLILLLPVSLFSWILGLASSEMIFLMGLGAVIGGIGGILEKIACSAQKKVWENDVSELRRELNKKEAEYLSVVDRASEIVDAAEKETRRVGQLLVEEESRRKALEDNKFPPNWWELVKVMEAMKKEHIELDKKLQSSEEKGKLMDGLLLLSKNQMAELRKEQKRMGNVLVSILDIVECRLLPQLRDKKWTVAPTELDALQFVLSPIVEDLVLIATMCERGGYAGSVKVGAIAKTTEGKLGACVSASPAFAKLRFSDGEESDWIKADTLTHVSASEEAKWAQWCGGDGEEGQKDAG